MLQFDPDEILQFYPGVDNFGRLTVLDSEGNIDPLLYPTVFFAEWQKYSINDEGNLIITGIHSQNQKIGNYKITIKLN